MSSSSMQPGNPSVAPDGVAIDDGRDDDQAGMPPPEGAQRGAVDRHGIERVGRWWLALALAIVVTPIVVATSRALVRGWLPLGDNGMLLVRARDVGTSHHPLLGLWTSASFDAGVHVNHPGPLHLDVIALPIKLLGPWVGVPTGVMLVNVAAVGFAVIVAGRLAGRLAMLSLAAAIAALEWSIGSEMLFDVWQANTMVLPALAFIAACWAMATGRPWYLPWALGIGSLLVQTHVSYVYLVPLGILGAGALGVGQLHRDGRGWAWAPWRRAVGVALAVAVVAWVQPVIEQFTASGSGNLSRLLDVARQDTDRLGLRLGLRVLAEVLAVPPFWGRPSYDTAIPGMSLEGGGDAVPIASLTAAVTAVGVLVALAGLAWWRNRAAGHRGLASMAAMALVFVAVALVSVTVMPPGVSGVLSPHQMRWLWPLGAFLFAMLFVTMVTTIQSIAESQGRGLQFRWAPGMVAAVGVVAAVAALPTRISEAGPTADRDALPFAKELAAGLDRLEGRGPVLFDTSTLLFAEPYSGVVFAQLQDRGIPFYVGDDIHIRHLGPSRRFDDNADVRIWLRSGGSVVPPEDLPPEVEEVVSVTGQSGDGDVGDRRAVALYAAPIEHQPDD